MFFVFCYFTFAVLFQNIVFFEFLSLAWVTVVTTVRGFMPSYSCQKGERLKKRKK